MNANLLRLAYVGEFLLAVIAVFTAWSEIGGQASLDAMYWAWKFGFGVGLSSAIVALTASFVASETWFTLRTLRWVAAIVTLLVGMGIVTYYYALEADTGDSEDSSVISSLSAYPGLQYSRPLSIRTK